jgi:hypothetical protein
MAADSFDPLAFREGVDFEAKAAQGRDGEGELLGRFGQVLGTLRTKERILAACDRLVRGVP